ncbi:MAG: hypothetical protein NXI32_05040 [bacterium]|nr:hypothetical protein [bacterium]
MRTTRLVVECVLPLSDFSRDLNVLPEGKTSQSFGGLEARDFHRRFALLADDSVSIADGMYLDGDGHFKSSLVMGNDSIGGRVCQLGQNVDIDAGTSWDQLFGFSHQDRLHGLFGLGQRHAALGEVDIGCPFEVVDVADLECPAPATTWKAAMGTNELVVVEANLHYWFSKV